VIFADKTEYEAEPVAIDEHNDLAILRIKSDKTFPAITLGRSDDLMIGETVIAIGNPLGYNHTVTSGIISATDRTLQVTDDVAYKGLIQTDASINRGNSGGPLLNILGEVIGINTAIRGDAQNIGFAIPIDTLRKVLPDMLALERRKQRLEVGLRLGWRDGIQVVAVHGPAAAAGIEAGDELVSVDGRPIRHEVDFYIYLLRLQPQDRLVLELKRNGKRYKVTLHPHQIPIPDGARLLREKFGFAVKKLSQSEAQDLQIDGGLVITEVERGSPAAAARFEPGLIVVQIGQSLPTDLNEVGAQLERVKSGERVTFRLWRIERQYIRVYAVTLTAR
jgi:serine protease Do